MCLPVQLAKELDKQGQSAVTEFQGGVPLLHWAALHNCVQVATLLVKFGAPPHALNADGRLLIALSSIDAIYIA